MNKQRPIYNIEIDELDAETGIELISMVDRPAIESNFIKLEEELATMQLKSDAQKQYVTGPVLIPEKHIFRRDAETKEEYYIKFSAENIEKIRNKFFRTGQLKLSNLDHSASDKIEAYLIESWIVTDAKNDKALALGFTDVAPGTLFATYHIPDVKTWEAVSERNGFSLEGNFLVKPTKLEEQKEETVESLWEDVLNALDAE